MKRLLVIEDTQKHMEDVMDFFAKDDVQVDYVSTFVDAMKKLEEEEYAGVLTDVFFPFGGEEYPMVGRRFERDWKRDAFSDFSAIVFRSFEDENSHLDHIRFKDMVDNMKSWVRGESLAPFGWLIFKECARKNIPCAMVTDTYHHGLSCQPVCHAFREVQDQARKEGKDTKNYGLVDVLPDQEGGAKNWALGYEIISR